MRGDRDSLERGERIAGRGGRPRLDPKDHWAYAGILAVLLILPFFVSGGSDTQHPLTFCGLALPPLCMSQAWFGLPCPGCGMTRSFVALTHGRIWDSLRENRLGMGLYLFFLAQAAYHVACLLRGREVGTPLIFKARKILAYGILVLLIANWLLGPVLRLV